jgi:hypothetical protein
MFQTDKYSVAPPNSYRLFFTVEAGDSGLNTALFNPSLISFENAGGMNKVYLTWFNGFKGG